MTFTRSVFSFWARGTPRLALLVALCPLLWVTVEHPAWVFAQDATLANLDWPSYGNDLG